MAKAPTPISLFVPPGIVAMISSGTMDGKSNIITVSMTTIFSLDTVGIYIVPQHHSCGIIKETGEFVLNYPTVDLLEAADYCGNNSGADVDKFAGAGLTKAPGTAVSAPLIAECPVSLECKVIQSMAFGMMECFIGEVKAYHAGEGFVDADGRLDFTGKGLLAYGGKLGEGAYMPVGGLLGYSGLSKGTSSAV